MTVTDSQTGRQAGRQADGQMDRQTDRQTRWKPADNYTTKAKGHGFNYWLNAAVDWIRSI